MEIAFQTEEIRDICEHASVAEDILGSELANSLRARLADIRAATTMQDLMLFQSESPTQGRTPKMAIQVSKTCEIFLVSNHRSHNGKAADEIDFSEVKRVRIIEIGVHE